MLRMLGLLNGLNKNVVNAGQVFTEINQISFGLSQREQLGRRECVVALKAKNPTAFRAEAKTGLLGVVGPARGCRLEMRVLLQGQFKLPQSLGSSHRLGPPLKLHTALVNQADFIAQTFNVLHAVGGKYNGRAFLFEIQNDIAYQIGIDGVKAAEGLIENEQFGAVNDRAKELQLLGHAFGEFL